MNVQTCAICGGENPEGLKMCVSCLEKFSPPVEILQAMLKGYPAESEGIKYGCISAFTIRTRANHMKSMRGRHITQVELMSGKTHSITTADPQRVKILKEF